ncbi:hypothetical protein I2494_12170 [Budviciaceae bacterium BWR-B9]|uniref:Uncharacterized protein n=1 Tax=Limnobaculum allomyrinae TaxID=2791986 RepID=A0ABS1IRT5_9GAMM|nr:MULTISPECIES: hypothetical protein [Limnobaculum]MBK5144465.1 hypothetical protein [Limnobaculum allomyrinae]MBV7692308.1 hypothetical protein [Limnobaculum sp. M2-1]
MKIQEKDGELVDIYSIYWVGNETLFLGFPRGYGGLKAYNLSKVTVVDKDISGEFVFHQFNNMNSICHWALIKERLLDDLLELDETAYKRFLEILKAEGQIDSDFY